MLETSVFMTAILVFLMFALFYGCMLLIAPNRCPAPVRLGQPSLQLVRKPPLELRQRFFGLILSAVLVFIFMRPVIRWMLHPVGGKLSFGKSPFPAGTARWDQLVFGLVGATGGYYLLIHAEKSVELMFSSDPGRLNDKSTRLLWTFAVRAVGFAIILFSLLLLTEFVRSVGN
jgi:hypothetical protein